MLVSKKKFNEKLEHLLGSLKFYKNREENTLKIIENKNGDSLSCMGSLATIYEITASKVLLVDKDIENFRKNIYIYSKLNLMGNDTRAYLAWNQMKLFCILMSNNKDFLDFILRALAEKNIEKMKENINAMLEPKVARQMMYDESIFFYLHVYVLLYLKIASYYGFDLEIESDIVPKELIDNTPAKEYPEPYEFMKKFDLNTITPEEWKAWIYEYYPKPEILKEFEEKGSFI